MEAKFSPRVKDVISYSREEALRLGNDFIGVEHLLLGLIREGDGKAIKILNEFHLELSEREQIKDALKHPSILRFTPSTEKFTLRQKPDGSCYFLDANKKCTEYELRPDTCRNHPQIGPRPGYCGYMKK